jgi:hypothetical protein
MKGTNDMFSEFYNEVLSYGPTAVLPQNLNSKWLQNVQKIADDFLNTNFNLNECKTSQEIEDPILSACVYAIIRYQYGDKFDLTPKDMPEKIVIYALSVTMETVNRKSNFGLKPPNLDNILSTNRIIAYKKTNPEFVKLLREACIIRESEKGWFQNIKEKILSSVGGS